MTLPLFFRRLLLVSLTGLALAVVAVATPLATAVVTPAQAQVSAEFQSALEPYGHWVRHARWGEVWVPDDVPPGWRPYTYGHWIYTEEWGWYWVADQQEEDWGWVVYHYGRWAHDRRLGWFWIPDDEWAPAWVDWRRGDAYVGWAPLAPDDVIDEYDDAPAYWVFVPFRYLLASSLHRHFLSPHRAASVIRNTVVINRTMVVEHRRNGRSRIAVNAGIAPAIVAAARRSPVRAFRVRPHVLPGTRGVAGAVAVRPQDLARPRPGQRNRALAPRIERTDTAVRPATRVTKPQPLGRRERGRLGTHPPRAAQGAVVAPPQPQRTAPPPVQRTTPSAPPPVKVTPVRPREDRNQRAPITRQGEPPPPARVKPQRPTTPSPVQVRPERSLTPPSPPRMRQPTAPRAPSPPATRTPRGQPAIRSAPPPRPVAPKVTRPSAPSPQVHKPPTHRQAPAGARHPAPKKSGDNKDDRKKRGNRN